MSPCWRRECQHPANPVSDSGVCPAASGSLLVRMWEDVRVGVPPLSPLPCPRLAPGSLRLLPLCFSTSRKMERTRRQVGGSRRFFRLSKCLLMPLSLPRENRHTAAQTRSQAEPSERRSALVLVPGSLSLASQETRGKQKRSKVAWGSRWRGPSQARSCSYAVVAAAPTRSLHADLCTPQQQR